MKHFPGAPHGHSWQIIWLACLVPPALRILCLAGWEPPGPRATREDDPTMRPGEDEELCSLSGHWKIFQHIDRHRYSTDDVVTAWVAWQESHRLGVAHPRWLDLGCGIGSVLLFAAWMCPSAHCTGIEAQPTRAALARRSVRYNGVERRVEVHEGDIRDASLLPDGSEFDIVTGTPPYFPVPQGGLPPCKERCVKIHDWRGFSPKYTS